MTISFTLKPKGAAVLYYTILYYVLCTMYYVRYTIYYTQYNIYNILHASYYIRYTVYCILYTIYYYRPQVGPEAAARAHRHSERRQGVRVRLLLNLKVS